MRSLSSLNRKSNGRSGASLTEVLIAILILSIGVSSVFALFPISILSSIKATQLTNAKLMQQNVEQYIRTNPGYLTVSSSVVAPGVTVAQGNAWQPSTLYDSALPAWGAGTRASVVVPTPKNGSYRSEPFRVYRAIVLEWDTSSPGTINPGSLGRTGLTEPNWVPQTFTVGGNPYRLVLDEIQNTSATGRSVIAWEPVDTAFTTSLAFAASSSDPRMLPINSWVVDPLGAATFGPAGDGTLTAPSEFGCYSVDGTGSGTTGTSVTAAGVGQWTNGLPRINAGSTTLTTAQAVSAHPDAWSEAARIQPLGLNSQTSIQLQPNPGISINSSYNRIIVRDGAGTKSVVRDGPSLGFNSTTGEITFTDPLPLSIQNDIGEVSVEEFDSRYTWIATVNNSTPNNPTIKMVVLFKRKFLPGEEHVYRSVFGNDPSGPYTPTDPILSLAGPIVLQNDQILVVWPPTDAATYPQEPRPHIQEGKYVMRAMPNGPGIEWYEIVSASITEATFTTPGMALITVDRGINRPSASTGTVDRAVLLRGIVEMFDL